MSGQRPIYASIAALVGAVALLSAQPAFACAVCYGEPGAPMTQWIQAGVLVLLGVVGTVLTGLASLMIFWMRRASKLSAPPQRTDQIGA